MPVMAEVGFFTTMNGNTSSQERDQYCDRGSSPVRNENSDVVANDLDGKLDNGESNSGKNESLAAQDGEVIQMEQTGDSMAVDVKCSNSENQENNMQTPIPLNASSSLAQTNNCASEILKVAAQQHISANTLPDASQSSKQKSGFPLPPSVSLVNSFTTSPYFTRSANKARLPSSVAHGDTVAQSTTCSLVSSGTPSTSCLTNSSRPVTTVAISLPESIEPAMNISAPTAAQDVSQTTAVTSAGTPSTNSLSNPSKAITTFATSLHESNEPAATILDTTGASDVSQTTAVTSIAISVPVSQMMTLPTMQAPFSNQAVKQDDPGSTSSIPHHIVTPQMLSQALATCTLPMNASAASTTCMEGNSSTPLAIPSLANKVEDLEPSSISDNVATISSSSFPSTSNSEALVAFPLPMTKLDPEVPMVSSDVSANVTQTTVAASSSADKAASESMQIANSSAAPTDLPALFPDFTPCSKCNSILVCSCPGPSSIGEGSGAGPVTCQAGCQGDCTCSEMKVNQVDGLNPSEQDVKPQIFPVVVSDYIYILWILSIVF